MTGAGPTFLAAVLAETFEEYAEDAVAAEAGQALHDALTSHGYGIAPIGELTTERATLNAAATGLVRRFAGAMSHLGTDLDRIARAMAAMDVDPDEVRRVEDGAWASVWLHGDWRWLTKKMTTEERTAAADAVERDWARTEADDPGLTHEASREDLRWWEA
ncbi:hypothetical protein Drose_05645 [Dactylosporangium roseum]|uniref:Uncharacterized protein n=1 Tax=Dactylosporangium roseum TaxID=47989 RepID=A0ABY5Z9S9_9ACTN|nr:hypothetical protein [Dactylosporangium roseum]UWZ37753.1 hypothetical protein Drose_05645 [Dactylosporangium roseum]